MWRQVAKSRGFFAPRADIAASAKRPNLRCSNSQKRKLATIGVRERKKPLRTAIIFDCEFLCLEGSQRRFWCAAHDPDPVIAQIGAVKLGLDDDFPLIDTFKAYVRPIDRFGSRYTLDPFFTRLTGMTEEEIDVHGMSLLDALSSFDAFSEGSRCWSWGKDELNMMAISCYIAGIEPSIPAHRFDNSVKLLLAAGMPIAEDVEVVGDRGDIAGKRVVVIEADEVDEIGHGSVCLVCVADGHDKADGRQADCTRRGVAKAERRRWQGICFARNGGRQRKFVDGCGCCQAGRPQ